MTSTGYRPQSLAEFLGHNPGGSGGKTTYLKKWKDRRPPEIDVWLHTRAPWSPIWQHQIPRVRTYEDRETKEKKRSIWGLPFNCLEDEATLGIQYRLDRDTGERVALPTLCPICKLVEYLRQMIVGGQLAVYDAVFDFNLEEDPKARRVLYAGSMVGGFKGASTEWDDLSAEVREECLRNGVDPREAWRDNAYAKLNYVFSVVDASQVTNGVQVATETKLLGDKVKEAIAKKIEQEGDEAGNPLVNPYPIRWKYNPNAKEFGKRYDALAMPTTGPNGIPLTDDVIALIYDAEPPDLAHVCRPGDARSLRSQLEQYALMELPWDDFFAEAEKLQAEERAADPATDFPFGANEEGVEVPVEAPAPPPAPGPSRSRAAVPAGLPAAARPPAAPPRTRAPAPPPPAPAETPPAARAPAAPGRPTPTAARSPSPPATPPRAAPAARPAGPPAQSRPTPPATRPAPPQATRPAAVKPPPAPPKAAPPPSPAPAAAAPPVPDGMIPCDDCGTPMAPTQEVCPKCGCRYTIDASATAAAPPPEADPTPIGDEPETGTDGDVIPF